MTRGKLTNSQQINLSLGAIIQKLRKDRGLTQAALGKKIGLSEAAVQAWEAGRNQPGLAELQALSQALGVPASTMVAEVLGELPVGLLDRVEISQSVRDAREALDYAMTLLGFREIRAGPRPPRKGAGTAAETAPGEADRQADDEQTDEE
jgi:transcriptional regulator with XRE-family HTH domain